MGCGNAKEKIENEIMAARLDRIEIQFERKKQMDLLKNTYGIDFKPSIIPDYIAPKPEKGNSELKQRNSLMIRKTKKITIKKKRAKSFALKTKKPILNRIDTISENANKN